MAVFTPVEKDDLERFLQFYDVGSLQSFEGIIEGIGNTNYRIITDQGCYILTIYEMRTGGEMEFAFALMEHLYKKGIHCAHALPDVDGQLIRDFYDKPAALLSCLDGVHIPVSELTTNNFRQIGKMLAEMHVAVSDFPLFRPNPVGLGVWLERAQEITGRIDEVKSGLAAMVTQELDFLEGNWPCDLPQGVIHADLFPDNVLFKDGALESVLDFELVGSDYFAYDLAIVINAWCFDEQNNLREDCLRQVLTGYEGVRPLEREEKEQLNIMCRAAALRFLISRLRDWLFHDDDNFVVPKDPREYIEKLEFHQRENILVS